MSSDIDFKEEILKLAKKKDDDKKAIDLIFISSQEHATSYLKEIVKLCTDQDLISKIQNYIKNPPKTIQKFFINKLGVIFKYPDPNAKDLKTNGHPEHLSLISNIYNVDDIKLEDDFFTNLRNNVYSKNEKSNNPTIPNRLSQLSLQTLYASITSNGNSRYYESVKYSDSALTAYLEPTGVVEELYETFKSNKSNETINLEDFYGNRSNKFKPSSDYVAIEYPDQNQDQYMEVETEPLYLDVSPQPKKRETNILLNKTYLSLYTYESAIYSEVKPPGQSRRAWRDYMDVAPEGIITLYDGDNSIYLDVLPETVKQDTENLFKLQTPLQQPAPHINFKVNGRTPIKVKIARAILLPQVLPEKTDDIDIKEQEFTILKAGSINIQNENLNNFLEVIEETSDNTIEVDLLLGNGQIEGEIVKDMKEEKGEQKKINSNFFADKNYVYVARRGVNTYNNEVYGMTYPLDEEMELVLVVNNKDDENKPGISKLNQGSIDRRPDAFVYPDTDTERPEIKVAKLKKVGTGSIPQYMVVVADGPGHLNVPNGTPLEKILQKKSFRIGHDVYREVSKALTNKSRTLNNTTYEKKFPQPQGITPVYIENDVGSKRDISYMSIKGDVANDKFTITGKPAGQPAVQSTGFSFKIGDDSVDFPFINRVIGLPSVKTLGDFATKQQTKVFKATKITVEFPKNLKKESIKSVLQQLDRRYTHDDTFTLIISEDELSTELSKEPTEVFEAQKLKNVVYLGRQPPRYLRPGNNISVTEIEQNEQKESLYLVVIESDKSDKSDTYPKAFPPFLSGFFHQSTEKKSTMRAPVVSLKERGATVFLENDIGETVIGTATTLRKKHDYLFIEATDQEIQDAFTEQVERYNKLFKALGKDNALPLEDTLNIIMPPQQGNEILMKRKLNQRRESYNSSLSYSTEQSFPNIPSGSSTSSTSSGSSTSPSLKVRDSDYSIQYEKLDGGKSRPSLYKVIYKDSESSLILPVAILDYFTKNHYLKQGTHEAIKQAKELGGKQQNKGQHKGQVLTAAQIVKGQQVASVDKMKVVKRPTIKEVLDN